MKFKYLFLLMFAIGFNANAMAIYGLDHKVKTKTETVQNDTNFVYLGMSLNNDIEMKNGSKIIFKGSDGPSAGRGLNTDFIIDECSELTEEQLSNFSNYEKLHPRPVDFYFSTYDTENLDSYFKEMKHVQDNFIKDSAKQTTNYYKEVIEQYFKRKITEKDYPLIKLRRSNSNFENIVLLIDDIQKGTFVSETSPVIISGMQAKIIQNTKYVPIDQIE